MKNFILLFVCFFIGFMSQIQAQQSRNLRNFDSIDLRISAHVALTQNPNYSLSIDASQRLLRQIVTRVVNRTLIIDMPGNYSNYNERIALSISAPQFKNLSISGSGNMKINRLQGNHLNINISGSGNFEASRATLASCFVAVSGSGNVDLVGTSNFIDVSLSGSGHVDADQMRTSDAKARISGSGNVSFYATHRLNAIIAGSGNVFYRGNPSINQNLQGSGAVRRM